MSTSKRVEFSGTGIPIRENDIDTDQIIPARFLKEITFEHMGSYLFYDARIDENGEQKDHVLNDEKYKQASFMIVGRQLWLWIF